VTADARGQEAQTEEHQGAIYNLATRDDRIVPARSVLLGSKFFGGPVRFVLAGSGHIAGVGSGAA
jgi:polyhydroxyalkanoate synthase